MRRAAIARSHLAVLLAAMAWGAAPALAQSAGATSSVGAPAATSPAAAAAGTGPVATGAAAGATAAATHPPISFTPHYTPGETLRYEVSFRTQTTSLVGGAVQNPQGAAVLGISVGLTLRLEALAPIPAPSGGATAAEGAGAATAPAAPPAGEASERQPLRLRATYERVAATLSGDSYDPAAEKLLSQYQNLEGRTIEFQLGPHGELQFLKGLEEVLQDERALEAARAWLEQLGAGLSAPQAGATPGESWEKSQAVPDAPLAGTSLQSTSSYLRDEACDIENPSGEQCAVVLMRFTLRQKGGEKNTTPEAFRRHGLRTSGEWTSHGDSLVFVSLRTGRTMSVTQSSEEVMDLNIRHEDGGAPFHYAGRSKTETHLLLLDEHPGR